MYRNVRMTDGQPKQIMPLALAVTRADGIKKYFLSFLLGLLVILENEKHIQSHQAASISLNLPSLQTISYRNIQYHNCFECNLLFSGLNFFMLYSTICGFSQIAA